MTTTVNPAYGSALVVAHTRAVASVRSSRKWTTSVESPGVSSPPPTHPPTPETDPAWLAYARHHRVSVAIQAWISVLCGLAALGVLLFVTTVDRRPTLEEGVLWGFVALLVALLPFEVVGRLLALRGTGVRVQLLTLPLWPLAVTRGERGWRVAHSVRWITQAPLLLPTIDTMDAYTRHEQRLHNGHHVGMAVRGMVCGALAVLAAMRHPVPIAIGLFAVADVFLFAHALRSIWTEGRRRHRYLPRTRALARLERARLVGIHTASAIVSGTRPRDIDPRQLDLLLIDAPSDPLPADLAWPIYTSGRILAATCLAERTDADAQTALQNVTEVLALNRRVAGLAHYDAHLLAASLIARTTHDDSAATAHLKQSNPMRSQCYQRHAAQAEILLAAGRIDEARTVARSALRHAFHAISRGEGAAVAERMQAILSPAASSAESPPGSGMVSNGDG